MLAAVCALMWLIRPKQGAETARAVRPLARWIRVLLIAVPVAVVLAAIAVGFAESGASRVEFAVAVMSGGSALFLLQRRWWLPWAAGLAVVAACPIVALLGGGGALDGLAMFALALLAMAIIRLAFDSIPQRPEAAPRQA